jgi:hypothetical protein
MYPTFPISQIIRSDGNDLVFSKSNYNDFIFKRSAIITIKLFGCVANLAVLFSAFTALF